MDKQTDQRMRAYLLRRLSDEERDAFETRLFEEPRLLEALKVLERELLAGRDWRPAWRYYGVSVLLGMIIGAVLANLVF